MSSGVTVTEDCVASINDMKTRKRPLTALIMRISDDNSKIEEDKRVGTELTLEDVKELCQEGGKPKYVLYDSFHKQEAGSKPKKRLQLIVWCPDTYNIKQKMLIASSKDALKKTIAGAAEKDWQWCDEDSAKENIDEQNELAKEYQCEMQQHKH